MGAGRLGAAGAGYEALSRVPRADGTTATLTRDADGRPIVLGASGAPVVLDERAVAVDPTGAPDGAGHAVALWLGPDGALRTARLP